MYRSRTITFISHNVTCFGQFEAIPQLGDPYLDYVAISRVFLSTYRYEMNLRYQDHLLAPARLRLGKLQSLVDSI